MDGLLLNSEDVITLSVNSVLQTHGRPVLSRTIRVQLMGIPESTNSEVFHDWAKLPISRDQFAQEFRAQLDKRFPDCRPLPGARELLAKLNHARSSEGKIELALASGTKTKSFGMKTSSSETSFLVNAFRPERRILGDDPRLPPGRGKPAPDIYILALQTLNSSLETDSSAIMPDECLVFEDSFAGVEAARSAGMRVVWVPHPDVVAEYRGDQSDAQMGGDESVAARGRRLYETGTDWIETLTSLEQVDYGKYGIEVDP